MRAVKASELGAEGRRLLGKDKKVLIVRPDGYVGYRGPLETRTAWLEYARQDALGSTGFQYGAAGG